MDNYFLFLGFPRKNRPPRPGRCCWSSGKYNENLFHDELGLVNSTFKSRLWVLMDGVPGFQASVDVSVEIDIAINPGDSNLANPGLNPG